MNREIKFQFVIDNKHLSAIYMLEQLLNKDEEGILEDMEVCTCSLNESNSQCEGDCMKYENSAITGKRQFTGLMSSDGGCNLPIKEAYFGDVIRFYNTEGKEYRAEIIWYELEHCIGFKRLSDGFVYTQRMFNDSGYFQPSKIQFEIIGNIHENPELLK